ncbi:MAG: ribbon-helix-helix domain-containing protein, partial [Promethearchaeota archaeon]
MTKKIKVKIELPKNVISFMDELIGRGYYKSRSEMFRVALIDLIIEKFDIDIDDIEPDILEKFEEEEEEEKVIIAEPAALLEE